MTDKTDPIVIKVLEKYIQRSALGIEKYGTTLEENDLAFEDWLTHLQEELMDAVLYIEKIKAVNDTISREAQESNCRECF